MEHDQRKQKIALDVQLVGLGTGLVDLASRAVSTTSVFPRDTPAISSIACYFQALIII